MKKRLFKPVLPIAVMLGMVGAIAASCGQSSTAPTTPTDTVAVPSTVGNSPTASPDSMSASENAADGSTTNTALPQVFADALPTLKQQTSITVLLPSELPAELTSDPLYPTVETSETGYTMTLGLTPDCSANVCSVGSINAEPGGTPYPDEFSQTVTLADGIEGNFQPMTCGASCAPPTIGWSYNDVFYRMSMKVGATDEEALTQLTEMANSAIEAGPR